MSESSSVPLTALDMLHFLNLFCISSLERLTGKACYNGIMYFPRKCQNSGLLWGTVQNSVESICTSGMFCSIDWWLFADVLGHPICPIFKGRKLLDP
jgi:hypothetical protein